MAALLPLRLPCEAEEGCGEAELFDGATFSVVQARSQNKLFSFTVGLEDHPELGDVLTKTAVPQMLLGGARMATEVGSGLLVSGPLDTTEAAPKS